MVLSKFFIFKNIIINNSIFENICNLAMWKKYNNKYILIDDKYEIDSDL